MRVTRDDLLANGKRGQYRSVDPQDAAEPVVRDVEHRQADRACCCSSSLWV